MRILVTGASGFIGRHLCSSALQHNFSIRAFLRPTAHPLPKEIEAIYLDSITTNIPSNALDGVDAVIHLAARAHILDDKSADPTIEFYQVNTQGTINLARSAIQAGVEHFIFISSIGAMTTTSTQLLTENSPCQPNTPYGQSKLAAEQKLIELCQGSSMKWTILRPTLVYGAGNPGNMERLMKLVKKNIPLPLGSIHNRRSFIYVGNLVDAILTCITHPTARNQTFLISDGQDLSTPDLIRHLAQAAGQPAILLPIPLPLLSLLGKLTGQSATIERLLGSLAVDSTHIQTTLNWKPPFSLDEGLSATLGSK
jgi:nucleoside-diphosphate-sugar epimerase